MNPKPLREFQGVSQGLLFGSSLSGSFSQLGRVGRASDMTPSAQALGQARGLLGCLGGKPPKLRKRETLKPERPEPQKGMLGWKA